MSSDTTPIATPTLAMSEKIWDGMPNTGSDRETPVGFQKENTPMDIEQASAKHEDPAPASPPPPPDGGLRAWLQVSGAFFLFFNSWGVVNTFGVFQQYYETVLLTSHNASAISWIGTMEGFLLFTGGMIAGPIFDKGHLTLMISFGSFMVVFGLMMTSLATEYYQIFLAQGICVGIGCSFLFLPSVATAATYFSNKRGLAVGVVASGGSIGSVIYPIIFRNLLASVGFAWATRVIGFISLGTLLYSIAVLRPRLPPSKQSRAIFDFAAFKEREYCLLCAAYFFSFMGLYFPFFYLPSFFKAALKSSDELSFYIIAILNGASIFGRITPGLFSDKYGSLNTVIPMAIIGAILEFAWIGIHNIPGAIVFVCLYGFVSGAIVSLAATVLVRISPNMAVVGTRMGMSFTLAGLGLLIGDPIAGTLLDINPATGDVVFWKAQLFSAMMIATGAVCFIGLRSMKGVRKLGKWI